MVRTRVGYAGGSLKEPSYHELGDHTETIQIEYDPAQISYEDLLEIFWSSHNPTTRAWSRQYRSVIFYHGEEQKQRALETRDREAARRGTAIYTEIAPAGDFTLAEDYHQKYRLRGVPDLMAEFSAIYPENIDFVNSTAVARVNGYLGGNGTVEQLEAELESLGLSPEMQEHLRGIITRRR